MFRTHTTAKEKQKTRFGYKNVFRSRLVGRRLPSPKVPSPLRFAVERPTILLTPELIPTRTRFITGLVYGDGGMRYKCMYAAYTYLQPFMLRVNHFLPVRPCVETIPWNTIIVPVICVRERRSCGRIRFRSYFIDARLATIYVFLFSALLSPFVSRVSRPLLSRKSATALYVLRSKRNRGGIARRARLEAFADVPTDPRSGHLSGKTGTQ